MAVYVWLLHGCFHNQIYWCGFLKAGEDEAALWVGDQAVARAVSPAALDKRVLARSRALALPVGIAVMS